MIHPNGQHDKPDTFNHVDQRLALGFGAIVLALMLTVSSVTAYLFVQQQRSAEEHLSQALAITLSEAMSRIAFSGKYHTRLLAEELRARVPTIEYMSLETPEGLIIASSDPEKNDQTATPVEVLLSRESLAKGIAVSRMLTLEKARICEIVLPYRGGMDAQIVGVVRIGVNLEQAHSEQRRAPIILLALITALTALAMLMVGMLSRYFGGTLRQLATQLQGILDHAPLAIWMSDKSGRISAKSAESGTLFAGVRDSEKELLLEMDSVVFESGTMTKREVEIDQDNARRAWLASIFPIAHDSQGNPSMACTFMLDITDRKKSEEALRKEEARFREIFNASTEAIFIEDVSSGKPLDVNESMLRMYGYDSKEEVLASHIGNLSINTPPYTFDEGMTRIRKTLAEGPQVFEWLARKKDGEVFWVEVALRSSEIGGETRILAVVRDISERKRAESERIEMERRMQHIQKLESLGVLAGGIAHDFNNLLMAILGNANLASIELSPASKTREYLSEIEQATKRAADLCRQMLAYSGRGKFVIQKIHLPDIVAEMTQLLKASISKKASLNLDLSDRLPAMEGDPTQIRQVIMNLITNASEALADENGVISVSTGLAQCSLEYLRGIITDEDVHPGAYVYIEVSDTGCGMDETTRARMFEPFFTTKFTGRGLGMAAVLGIMRGHKGAITIDSVPEQGTTIRALFPAMDDIAPQGQPTSSETTESLKNTGGVLLVDDEESNRNIAGKMLNRLGFKVFLANDGSQALDEYRAHKAEIELVVLDLTMPNMDGEEAFRELRKMDPNIRVIISSGYTEQEIIRRFEGRNISGFIEKPYTLEALNNALKPLYGDERAE